MLKKIIIWPLLFLISISQLVSRSLLPQPWHHISLVAIFFLLFTIFYSGKKTFLFAIPVVFFLEQYQSSPFGSFSLAFLLSIFLWHWIINYATTNRSPLIIFLFSLSALLSYRLLYWCSLTIFSWWSKITYLPKGEEFLNNSFWEIVLSAFLITGLYFLIINIFKRLNPRYLNTKQI